LKSLKDTLDAELDEIKQLEEVGFLPKGTAAQKEKEYYG
jgi:hypothetical protein